MQNISSRNSSNKSIDAKGFCTNTQCQIVNKELLDLREQVTNLKETAVSLENTIQIKDAQLQNMQRDNERLSTELKKQQRCIRNVKLGRRKVFLRKRKGLFQRGITAAENKMYQRSVQIASTTQGTRRSTGFLGRKE